MKCLVVVPTFNERENIREFIQLVLAQGDCYQLLVVDDNSPDGTGQVVDEMALGCHRVRVLHRASRLGLGTAYVEGFRLGLAAGYDYIFQMDADFSHDPGYLPAFLETLEAGYDVVVGSRNVRGGGVRNWPLSRRLISRGGSLYARTILGLEVHDVTAGYKGFRRRSLEMLGLDSIRSNGYSFQIEMAHRCQRLGLRTLEYPIIFVDRTRGGSKMSRKIFLEAMGICWRLRLDPTSGDSRQRPAVETTDQRVARMNRS